MIAIGIAPDGKRSVLGITFAKGEDEEGYWEPLVSLWECRNGYCWRCQSLGQHHCCSGNVVRRWYCVVRLKRN
ncbi:transposase [Stygiolobus caldivivus]|uniref:transposase n=1 Tax=Stygiolobus caldivivus TaxID=2824673 RepID=UPI001C852D40